MEGKKAVSSSSDGKTAGSWIVKHTRTRTVSIKSKILWVATISFGNENASHCLVIVLHQYDIFLPVHRQRFCFH